MDQFGPFTFCPPGTITVEVNGRVLLVHVLDEISGKDVTSRRIESKIAEVFGERASTS